MQKSRIYPYIKSRIYPYIKSRNYPYINIIENRHILWQEKFKDGYRRTLKQTPGGMQRSVPPPTP
jgi:hypothetical protein